MTHGWISSWTCHICSYPFLQSLQKVLRCIKSRNWMKKETETPGMRKTEEGLLCNYCYWHGKRGMLFFPSVAKRTRCRVHHPTWAVVRKYYQDEISSSCSTQQTGQFSRIWNRMPNFNKNILRSIPKQKQLHQGKLIIFRQCWKSNFCSVAHPHTVTLDLTILKIICRDKIINVEARAG